MTQLHSKIICRECRVPFDFHSTQIVGAPNNVRHVTVFECRQCGRLTAEEVQQLRAA
jgi:RNase P subunit RPR2